LQSKGNSSSQALSQRGQLDLKNTLTIVFLVEFPDAVEVDQQIDWVLDSNIYKSLIVLLITKKIFVTNKTRQLL